MDFMMAHMTEAPPELLAAGPPPPTPEDPRDYYLQWMDAAEGDLTPRAGDLPFCEFELGYWAARKSPWLLHVHYADLKADLTGEIQRISEFLEIDTPPALLRELAAAATFDSMKRDGEALLPKIGEAFDKGSERFLNKGTNGRWKDFLTAADLARYDALVRTRFSPDMARWVEGGRLAAGDPRRLGDGAPATVTA
jgi:aryl sulfotransferase